MASRADGLTVDRPRDRYGRPLPSDADPSLAFPSLTQPPTGESTLVTGADTWARALALLSDDLPFHAHEVFEQRWRCCPTAERDLWRALAPWAAALTHRARGNPIGARRLAERAAAGLETSALLYAPDATPTEADLSAVRASLADLVAE